MAMKSVYRPVMMVVVKVVAVERMQMEWMYRVAEVVR
jgi:hypothetical protein